MNKPLVSVIIPAYNHEMYVEETINSIIAQTYENIELIVVDDGSKDSTWQKICAMRERCDARFKRVVFETQVNQGCCTTLNKLISLAQGEFLYLIASDDVSVPVAIEKQATFLAENPDYVQPMATMDLSMKILFAEDGLKAVNFVIWRLHHTKQWYSTIQERQIFSLLKNLDRMNR